MTQKHREDLHVTSFSATQRFALMSNRPPSSPQGVIAGTPPKALARSVVAAFHWDLITFPGWSCQLTQVNLFVFDDVSVRFESIFYSQEGDVWIIRPGITFFQDFGTGMAQIGRPLGQHDSPSITPPPGLHAGSVYFNWDDTIDGATPDTVKLINTVSGWANHC